MELKTPLYNCHVAAGAKLIPFAGYLLPVQCTGIVQEHLAVRRHAGLFDVSHMGEVLLCGAQALENLNRLFCNDFSDLPVGRIRYSPLCNETGGIVDDAIVYHTSPANYMMVVNAANRQKDIAWMRTHLQGEALLQDVSDSMAQLALQGPKSRAILQKLTRSDALPQRYYTFTDSVQVAGVTCLVSQTGYTGEHGYELYCPPGDAPALWNALLEAGEADGLLPCGLGARDTLRLEAGMPLYGHEMNDDISPLEAGLHFAVKMQKPDFIGKAALLARGEPGVERAGIRITGRGIAREQNAVYLGDEAIGHTTSGTHCPYLNGAYAMALLQRGRAPVGTAVEVEVRGRRIAGEIVSLPFYKKP